VFWNRHPTNTFATTVWNGKESRQLELSAFEGMTLRLKGSLSFAYRQPLSVQSIEIVANNCTIPAGPVGP
jgi:hypothetical protein